MHYEVQTMVGARRRVRIQAQGQVPLPADLLHKHHLKTGDAVDVEDTDQGLLITPPVDEDPMTTEDETTLFAKPSAAEIARRQALFAQVMARRQGRVIHPLTSTDLVQLARAEEGSTDDPGA